jgi:Uma2 family endonuclease
MTTILTQLSALPIEPAWAPFPTSIYRLTIDQYEAMVASEILGKSDRLHLIDGILVSKMTKKPRHVIACELTRDALIRIAPPGWRVATEAPVRIPEYNEPEPDITVVRGNARDPVYRRRHPGPADIAVIVEVADASLSDDYKMAKIYAAAGIPAYWILNLVDQLVTVFSDPTPAGYRSIEHLMVGHAIPVEIDGVEFGPIPVAEIMPADPQ